VEIRRSFFYSFIEFFRRRNARTIPIRPSYLNNRTERNDDNRVFSNIFSDMTITNGADSSSSSSSISKRKKCVRPLHGFEPYALESSSPCPRIAWCDHCGVINACCRDEKATGAGDLARGANGVISRDRKLLAYSSGRENRETRVPRPSNIYRRPNRSSRGQRARNKWLADDQSLIIVYSAARRRRSY